MAAEGIRAGATRRRRRPGRTQLSAGLAAALVTLPLLVGCRQQGEGGRPAPPPLSVSTETLSATPFSTTIDTISTLEAIEEVKLSSQAGGRIRELRVSQGNPVRAGELVLVLDQVQARSEVARLRAQARTDQINAERFAALAEQGAASVQQRDEFRQQAVASREELRAAEADLAFRDVRAPISGIVADLQVKVGDVIEANEPFTRIVRNDQLQARLEVPALYAERVRPGQTVVLLDPSGERELGRGRVGSVDPLIDDASQFLLAKAEFNNPTGSLRSGLRSLTRLLLEERRELSVPFQAVSQQSGQAFVFVPGSLADLEQNPGRVDLESLRNLPAGSRFAIQVPVRLGPLQNNRYPVLSGLEPGQAVITSRLINLRHGLPIQLGGTPSPSGNS
ncbi:MAG: efflux RND transporter periplasmic adaptor subunit [Prochlorococcaceae cyanobacterium]